MTGKDILEQEFERTNKRGYDPEHVDEFLREVASYVDELAASKEDCAYKMQLLADKVEEYKADEESIRDALLNAQKLANSILNEAKEKSETLTKDAQEEHDRLINETKEKAEAMTKESLQKANLDLLDLRRECDKEKRHLEKMKQEVSLFKASILKQYKNHLDLLANLPVDDIEEETASNNDVNDKEVPVSEPIQETVNVEETAVENNEPIKEENISEQEVTEETDNQADREKIEEEIRHSKITFSQELNEHTKQFEPIIEKEDSIKKPNYMGKFGELKFGNFSDDK